MEAKRKYLRRLAGISIILILVFMMIALLRFQKEEDMALLPDQFEVYYNESWIMVSLDGEQGSKVQFEDHDRIQELIQEELAEGKGQEITLPYAGSSKADEIVVYQNTLPTEYAGLTLHFLSTNAIVRVVLDGEVIYEYGLEEATEKTSGSVENYVSLTR